MKVGVCCTRGSNGAKGLVDAMNATQAGSAVRLRSLGKAKAFLNKPDSVVLMWGDYMPGLPTSRVLNNLPKWSKYKELGILKEAGVPVPEFSKQKPSEGPDVWLARLFAHQGANDLLQGLTKGDYYVKLIPDIVKEFRVHVYRGKAIRTGIKVKEGPGAHPIFHTHTAGWVFKYGPTCKDALAKGVIPVAKQAVEATGLHFGAVDVGVRKGGKVVVWEVNRAPGLVGQSLELWASYILAHTADLL